MIRKKVPQKEIIIDLTGPMGNAFCLLGYADKFAKELGYTVEERDTLRTAMTSSDYDNLVKIFDMHFGSFVILEN